MQQLIGNLVEKDIITAKEAENINLNSILKFTETKIWKEMQCAQRVEREKPFYIKVPAKDIYNEDIPEDILVQGIIDLYYITQEGKLILVDYKTDFVQVEEELKQKYTTQLMLYKNALEEALNQQVDNIYIYSTFLGKEIELV